MEKESQIIDCKMILGALKDVEKGFDDLVTG